MVALTPTDMAMDETAERVQADLALSDAELATALGVSLNKLRSWRSGASFPEAEPSRRLRQLAALTAHLGETFRAPGGSRWLRSESRYLGGQRPLDALLRGEAERVEDALEALDSGIFV